MKQSALKYVKPSEIVVNPDNPRFIKDDKFRKLVKSIQEFPDMTTIRPIIVDEGMMVLGGNMRYRAMVEAGIEKIPVVVVSGWSDEQKKEFIIKDNASFGDWDYDSLANMFSTEELEDWGVDVKLNLPEDSFLNETTDGVEVKSEPRASGDDYSMFELVMLHENKLILLETLNAVKAAYLFEKTEDALMEIIRQYKNTNERN